MLLVHFIQLFLHEISHFKDRPDDVMISHYIFNEPLRVSRERVTISVQKCLTENILELMTEFFFFLIDPVSVDSKQHK